MNFEERDTRKMNGFVFDIVTYKISKKPRPGIWGKIGRFLHLPFGWIDSLSELEKEYLLLLGRYLNIIPDDNK